MGVRTSMATGDVGLREGVVGIFEVPDGPATADLVMESAIEKDTRVSEVASERAECVNAQGVPSVTHDASVSVSLASVT